MTGEEATRRGYRRISNKYLLVARVDRPDWVRRLARLLVLPVETVDPSEWADYYRRVLSEDRVTLGAREFKKVPGSSYDPTGYVAEAAGGNGDERRRPLQVTDDHLDAPDGAVVLFDGGRGWYERVGSTWQPRAAPEEDGDER